MATGFIFISRYIFSDGLTLFPFIILRKRVFKNDITLINHERIHLHQQMELFVIPFYIIYIANYLVNLLWYHNHSIAYRKIIFEKEAFDHEKNHTYLLTRKRWQFIRYIKE